ncbi:polymeric immunoglobulin receptor isoform X2 [Triplophysa dalaica]|nr:polymeric immunoglobulin receptor isoform X2 [Triplophysa dalaica]XP_056619523.1 polymeric immunoglobulin receptor isoform X2 [Triplophysa dalaica]
MMKTLLFISIYLLGQVDRAAETVSGIVGESLVINCPYNKKTEKDRERSFCKKNTNKCATLRGEQSNLWTDGGRFSMHDNTSVGLLSVFIKNLTNNDQGTYECKVENKSDLKLKLEEPVEHDACCGESQNQTGYVGGSVTVSCKYPGKYKNYEKHLFRVNNASLGSVIHGYKHTNGRHTIVDNPAAKVFNVTINKVDRHDEGIYFCGSTKEGKYIHLLNVIYLNVSNQNQTSSDSYVIIIIVCVCLILMAAGGLILLWYKLGCKKNAGSKSSSNQRTSIDCQEQSTVVYYETIDESKTGSATVNPTVNVCTVYTTAELPTIPSDRDFYTMAESPERPADP